MTYWRSPEFKAIQEAWYQRLRGSGFEDAEEMIGDDMVLKQSSEHVFHSLDALQYSTKESYYNFVSEMVQITAFRNEVDRLILVNHATGKKPSQICLILKEAGLPRCRHSVRFRIRVYEMKWGLRSYTPRQLNRVAG